jgi:hypothetical protein
MVIELPEDETERQIATDYFRAGGLSVSEV